MTSTSNRGYRKKIITMKKQSPFIFFPTKELLLPSDKYVRKVGDIVMRPSDGRVAIANVLTVEDPQECIPQYIYVLSNEKPKEGEWSYCPIHLGGKIFPAKGNGFICDNCKKIIATTNSELHTKKNPVHNENSYIDDVAKISQSDIEYIISLHNGDVKEVVDVEKLAELKYPYASSYTGQYQDILIQRKCFIDGYNQSLQSNANGFSSEEIIKITSFLKTQIVHKDKALEIARVGAFEVFEDFIQSITKKQSKKNSVMVEYEEVDKYLSENEPSDYKPILDNAGNIIIVR